MVKVNTLTFKQMNKTVLMIDDDPFALFINQEIIQPLIIPSPKTYFQAKEALKFLKENHSEDMQILIFLDLNMPEMNGWEFLDEIDKSDLKKNIFVVIITSSIDQRDYKKAQQYPNVSDFVVKPINQQLIKNLVQNQQISTFFK